MGKSSRAYRSREIKGQRREVLEAAEKTFGVLTNDPRKAALEVAAAQPPVPVVNKRKGAETESAAAMEVEGDRAPQTEEERTAAGEARLRRVLGATPGQFKKSAHKLKQLGITPVHPNPRAMRKMKKALKRGAAL